MPFSFVDIEAKKTRKIIFLFIFLVLFYFAGAWLIAVTLKILLFSSSIISNNKPVTYLSPKALGFIFSFAVIIGVAHWSFSVSDMNQKILRTLKVCSPDKDDKYHKRLINIIEEIKIASGNRNLECVVLPLFAMNAFSISDLRNRSVIGVTEGILSRLSRPQLEAVVAHEAAHIVSNDTLIKTVAVSLFGIYGAALNNLRSGLSNLRTTRIRVRGAVQGIFCAAILYLVISVIHGLGKLISSFVSRECEYRADSAAVRITRNPLSLAQSLYLISKKWRGAGFGYENVESLFIVNPAVSRMDESEGFFANLFSTHPPVLKRIGILLDMAHQNISSLEEQAKLIKKSRHKEIKVLKKEEVKWMVNKDGNWQGPFLPVQLINLEWLTSDTYIKPQGSVKTSLLYQHPDLVDLIKNKNIDTALCPKCLQPLSRVYYESVPVQMCNACKGVLVDTNKIPRILIRQEQGFTDDIVRQAELISQNSQRYNFFKNVKIDNKFNCPKCSDKMITNFYSFAHPIEVERCFVCNITWFDKNELEILQYLVEKAAHND